MDLRVGPRLGVAVSSYDKVHSIECRRQLGVFYNTMIISEIQIPTL